MTEGNPYFVSELVASADEARVPPTVVDAVTGRLRRLDAATQDHVEQLAVVPSAVDRDLLARLVPGSEGALRAAEEGGLLAVSPDGVRFRHELTRRAVVDALPTSRRIELERRALAALVASGVADPARLVHHALAAGDVDAVAEWAPRAARDAAASGAHRQAAAHYRAALDHADRFEPAERADLWEEFAIESYTIGASGDAMVAESEAIALRRQLGDQRRLGASLRWLSRFQWFGGRRADAEASAREASAVLADAGDPSLLAMALSNESQLALLAHDSVRAMDLAGRAIAIARETGDRTVLSHALNNHGTALMFRADETGIGELVESAEVALAVDDMEDAARAYVNLVWGLLDQYRLDLAEHHLARAMELTERAEFIGFVTYQRMEQGRLDLARARWDDALAVGGGGPRGSPCPLRRADRRGNGATPPRRRGRRRRARGGAAPRRRARRTPATRAGRRCAGGGRPAARRPRRRARDRTPGVRRGRPPERERAPRRAGLPAAPCGRRRRRGGRRIAIRSRSRRAETGGARPTSGTRRARRTTRPRRSPRAPTRPTSSTRSRSSTVSVPCRSRAGSGPTCAGVACGASRAARRA